MKPLAVKIRFESVAGALFHLPAQSGVSGLGGAPSLPSSGIFHLPGPVENEPVDLGKPFRIKHLGAMSLSTPLLNAARRGGLSGTA